MGIVLLLLLVSMSVSAINVQFSEALPTKSAERGTTGILGLIATDWNKTYGGPDYDSENALVQTSDGGYALAGYTNSSGSGDFWLVRTDPNGVQLWNKTYGGASDERAYALVQTSDGGYALAGCTSRPADGDVYHFWLVKTDSAGNAQWNKTYLATIEIAYSLVQTADGGYALAGYTYSLSGSGYDFWLVKTDSAGNAQWNKTYGGTSLEIAYSLVQTADGGYALAGKTTSFGAGLSDFWLAKTDASGNLQWNMTYGGTGTEEARALVQTGDGGYALAGRTNSSGAGNEDSWLVKIDADGNAQWNKTYGGTGYEIALALVQTGDGGYALAGQTNSYGAGLYDFWLAKTDASGNLQWNMTYGGASNDMAYALVHTGDCGYALAGYTSSFGAGIVDFWLVKLTPLDLTVYIRADGSVEPPTAPIRRNGDAYVFTDNIYSSGVDGIVIERDNIVLEGAGHLLDGGGTYNSGIVLSHPNSNVTVNNVSIHAFSTGIYLEGGSRNMIVGNNVTDCPYGIMLLMSSWNTLAGNRVAESDYYGIVLDVSEGGEGSSNNTIAGNTLTNNVCGVNLTWSPDNSLFENTITASNDTGLWIEYSSDNVITSNDITANNQGLGIYSCSNNSIYHNNFADNSYQVSTSDSANIWDEGYPSGGNYWSDYNGTDLFRGSNQDETGSDGIGDSHYLIDLNNQDNYPLMKTWSARYTRYDWPTFHHDLVRTGYSESPAPNTNQTKWNYTADGYLSSSPAVVDGKVYVGSWYGTVYCFDASTGTRIWSYLTEDSVYSSPAVAYGRVYVGSSDKTIYCLDALTGASLWNHTTGHYVGYSSPAVAYGKVYVGSEDNNVYCLDAFSGALIWNYTTGDDVESSPAVAYGRVYVGSSDRKVYCLDALAGTSVWNYTTGGGVWSSPAVVDGKIYIGSEDTKVYCLDAFTGVSIWNYTTGSWVTSSPAVAYGRVYVGSFNCQLLCLDATTGTSIWNYTTTHYVASSPAVADGKVYVGSYDGEIYCLNSSNGAAIWNYATGDQIEASPAVADGVVYVGSFNKVLYAFGTVTKVPEDFPTIQAAINAASPGDTIWIAPGIYHESIIINKTITLIGKPGSEPTFDGGGSGIAITIVPSGSGSTIAGIVITSWDKGIVLVNASDCKIYDTIMSLIGQEGIAFEGKEAVNNIIYSSIFEYNAVGFNLASSSYNNTICNNIVSLSGIGLNIQSSGNLIYANIMEQNQLAINMINSNDNKFCHNNFFSNNVVLSIFQSTGNIWDDGYPSGGNYWSCHVSNDDYSGSWQNVSGSDGIVDVPYTVATDNIDRYPLLNPFSIHNIGMTRFATSKTIVGQSFPLRLNLTIQNFGMYNETFGLSIYANTTFLNRQTVDLTTRLSINVSFTWNTTSFAKATYTLSVSADTLAGETVTSDNVFCCTIIISIPGDINGNGIVNILDAINLGNSFLATSGSSNWNPNADINDDSVINILDSIIMGMHFLEHYP